MTTIVTRAGKNAALSWQEADSNFTNLNSAKLENVEEDLTPSLGGNLDVNGKSIVSVTNGNINITPHGIGKVLLKGVKFGPGGSSVATNTAGGNSALDNNTTGSNNTSFGYEAMLGNTNGGNNTSFGTYSLKRNANNSSNTAIGYNSLNYAVGGLNTAIGASSGVLLDIGTNNTFLGYNAGSSIISGSHNIVVGSNNGSTINGLSNNIIISDGAGNIRLSFDSTGNGNINGILTTDKLQIDTTVQTGSLSVGQLAWNDSDGCLEYQLKGGNVTLQVGQEQVLMITNQTGSTLNDGQIVYINGSAGQRPTVALASASSEALSSKTIGMVTETILNGSDGFITTNGIVNGLNTSSIAAGTSLWLDTTAGLYTITKPTSPNHCVFVGWVVRQHATAGSIYVHIQNGYELDELHNVLISSVGSNQTLIYDSTATVWKNTALKTINNQSIIGTGDITISGGTGGSTGFEQTFLLMGA